MRKLKIGTFKKYLFFIFLYEVKRRIVASSHQKLSGLVVSFLECTPTNIGVQCKNIWSAVE